MWVVLCFKGDEEEWENDRNGERIKSRVREVKRTPTTSKTTKMWLKVEPWVTSYHTSMLKSATWIICDMRAWKLSKMMARDWRRPQPFCGECVLLYVYEKSRILMPYHSCYVMWPLFNGDLTVLVKILSSFHLYHDFWAIRSMLGE